MRVCRDDFDTGSGLELSYHWGLGLIPGKSKYINLWWIKCHWKKFLSEYICSLLSLSSHRCSVIYFIHLPKTLYTYNLSCRRHHRIKHFFLCVSVFSPSFCLSWRFAYVFEESGLSINILFHPLEKENCPNVLR